MAEKKYIGKPGKQDDPCWKGYEMVGMKKKNGKSVPNCVPEATDIIEKAKKIAITKARGKKDWTGAQAPKDQFLMPEETAEDKHFAKQSPKMQSAINLHLRRGLDYLGAVKAARKHVKEDFELDEAVQTSNPGYGYHGNVEAKDDADRAKKFSAMHSKVKKMVAPHLQDAKKPNVMVRHFLDSTHGRHIAYDSSERNIKSRFAHFKKSYNPAMHEEVDLEEAVGFSHRDYAAHGLMHPSMAKHMKVGHDMDYYLPKTGDKHEGRVVKNDGNTVHIRAVKNGRIGAGPLHKFKITPHLPQKTNEELGKSNEWGRPELRKKYAAMTPGQESMTADQIPSFDPRYDDVTTQYCGGLKEGFLAEISARGAVARAKFQTRVQKVLSDPEKMRKAKKSIEKQKATAKAKEPAHLVMQLRKAVSIGSKVHFQDGSHHKIAPNHADQFMSKYNSAKSSIEKEALQKRAHKSHAEFMRTIAEEFHENCGTPDCCMQCDTAEMGTHHVDTYEKHKGSGDQIPTVISHDEEDIRFQDFNEEEFEKQLEADVLALEWEDIADFYDDDEFEEEEDFEDEDEDEDEKQEIEEAITPQGRLKKKFAAMRTKTRRNMARNLALKRVSTPERVKARSVRAARRMVYKRLLRNRDISTVSAAEKTRLEAQVKRMAPMVARLSVRIMPKVRKLEQSRIQHARMRKK